MVLILNLAPTSCKPIIVEKKEFDVGKYTTHAAVP
jgi:hypothetical protein